MVHVGHLLRTTPKFVREKIMDREKFFLVIVKFHKMSQTSHRRNLKLRRHRRSRASLSIWSNSSLLRNARWNLHFSCTSVRKMDYELWNILIVGALVTWAIYTQGQLLL